MKELKREEEESMNDILSSIRQLVYPQASSGEATIIDLTRCVDEEEEGSVGIEEAAFALSSFKASLKKEAVKEVEQRVESKKTVEEFLQDLILPTLESHVEKAAGAVLEKEVRTLLPMLLKKWMDEHLAPIVVECVERKLDDMQRDASQRQSL